VHSYDNQSIKSSHYIVWKTSKSIRLVKKDKKTDHHHKYGQLQNKIDAIGALRRGGQKPDENMNNFIYYVLNLNTQQLLSHLIREVEMSSTYYLQPNPADLLMAIFCFRKACSNLISYFSYILKFLHNTVKIFTCDVLDKQT